MPRLQPVKVASLAEGGWSLAGQAVQELLGKVRRNGVPLGEYVGGGIYRGVLTGRNEAFVIDDATRKRLVREDKRSAELIKPFLAGRDIKRYETPQPDKYLVFTRRGTNLKEYPAIEEHLRAFKTKLMPKPEDWKPKKKGEEWPGRKAGNYAWYEIQDTVDYWEEFEKPKIIVPSIVQRASYAWDDTGFYSNDKTSIIPTNDLYLLGVLNSAVPDFVMHSISSTKQGGFFEYKPMYLTQLPIRPVNLRDSQDITRHHRIIRLVSRMLELHRQQGGVATPTETGRLQREIAATESEIDSLVYSLYSLTPDEIRVVEGEG